MPDLEFTDSSGLSDDSDGSTDASGEEEDDYPQTDARDILEDNAGFFTEESIGDTGSSRPDMTAPSREKPTPHVATPSHHSTPFGSESTPDIEGDPDVSNILSSSRIPDLFRLSINITLLVFRGRESMAGWRLRRCWG